MKRVYFNNEEKLIKIIKDNCTHSIDEYFSPDTDMGNYRLTPSYSIGVINDFFHVVDVMSEDVDLRTGKKPTKKQRKERVWNIEEKGGHSGASWGYLQAMVREFYPDKDLYKYIFED